MESLCKKQSDAQLPLPHLACQVRPQPGRRLQGSPPVARGFRSLGVQHRGLSYTESGASPSVVGPRRLETGMDFGRE